MQIIHNLANFPKIDNAVVTVGAFDGVHLGHHRLLQQLNDTAKKNAGKSVVVTFNPHPQIVIGSNPSFFCINSFEQKIALLEKEGVDYLLVLPFTKQFSDMTFAQFIKNILIDCIGTRTLIMGPNHSMGKNREGSYPAILSICEKEKITVILIDEYILKDIAIRSTEIRNAILQKDYTTAETLLGHSTYQKIK